VTRILLEDDFGVMVAVRFVSAIVVVEFETMTAE
jgi:hypothetical protein